MVDNSKNEGTSTSNSQVSSEFNKIHEGKKNPLDKKNSKSENKKTDDKTGEQKKGGTDKSENESRVVFGNIQKEKKETPNKKNSKSENGKLDVKMEEKYKKLDLLFDPLFDPEEDFKALSHFEKSINEKEELLGIKNENPVKIAQYSNNEEFYQVYNERIDNLSDRAQNIKNCIEKNKLISPHIKEPMANSLNFEIQSMEKLKKLKGLQKRAEDNRVNWLFGEDNKVLNDDKLSEDATKLQKEVDALLKRAPSITSSPDSIRNDKIESQKSPPPPVKDNPDNIKSEKEQKEQGLKTYKEKHEDKIRRAKIATENSKNALEEMKHLPLDPKLTREKIEMTKTSYKASDAEFNNIIDDSTVERDSLVENISSIKEKIQGLQSNKDDPEYEQNLKKLNDELTKVETEKEFTEGFIREIRRKQHHYKHELNPRIETAERSLEKTSSIFKDADEVKSDKPIKDSDTIMINNIFNMLKPEKGRLLDRPDALNHNIKKPDKDQKVNKKMMKKWTKNFEKSLKNIMGDFSKNQKKVLDGIMNKLNNKFKEGNKKSEDDFYKELILMLLSSQAFSKDLQGVGQPNVVPVNQESYL